jgi:hypothetical protein
VVDGRDDGYLPDARIHYKKLFGSSPTSHVMLYSPVKGSKKHSLISLKFLISPVLRT